MESTQTQVRSEAYWAALHAEAAADMHQAGLLHDTASCGYQHRAPAMTPGELAMLAFEGGQAEATAAASAYAATLSAVQFEALSAEYARMGLAGTTIVRTRSWS